MAIGLDQAIATKSILFIDPTIENYQSLIGGLTAENRQDACSTKIVVLDAYRDGIEQISETVARNEGLKAIHILSHGGPGCLYLGNSQLSNETVGRYTSQLRQWGEALGENADILLYGCKVGADLAFVRQLRKLTGANIAASATSTGNAALGGDWNLEVRVGEVSTPLAFESATMETYSGLLNRLFAFGYDYDIVELNPSTGAEINSFFSYDAPWFPPEEPEDFSIRLRGLAFDGKSLFFFYNEGSDTQLWELDPDTGAFRDVDVVSVPGVFDGLAALGGKLYLLDSWKGNILEFDPVSDTITNTLSVDLSNVSNFDSWSRLQGLAGATSPNALLTTFSYNNDISSELLEINPSTGSVTNSFSLPPTFGDKGVAVIDNEIYINNSDIEVYNRTGELQRTTTNYNVGWGDLGGDDVGLIPSLEPNDTLVRATHTGLTTRKDGTFFYAGEIGDNPNVAPGEDVDLFKFGLDIGEQLLIPQNIDLLDENGSVVASVDVRLLEDEGSYYSDVSNSLESYWQGSQQYYIFTEDDDYGYPGPSTFYLEISSNAGNTGHYNLTFETIGRDMGVYDTGKLYFSQDSAAEGNGLYTLDTETGAASFLGMSNTFFGGGSNVGLAPSDSSRILYGSEPQGLLTINTDGSGADYLGDSFPYNAYSSSGLAYDATMGILYHTDGYDLFTVNPYTGYKELWASSNNTLEGLAFGNGGAYALGAGQDLLFYGPSSNDPYPNLFVIGDTGQSWSGAALAYDEEKNVLYAKRDGDTSLYQIDVSTAQPTVVGDTGIMEGGGLAWVKQRQDEEPNDTLVRAIHTGLTLTNSGTFSYSGEIGDNTNLLPEDDVDFFKFDLDAGETVRLPATVELLDDEGVAIATAELQMFDSTGYDIPLIPDPSDPNYLINDNNFVGYPLPTGTFYVGISWEGNTSYDPNVEGSGSGSSNPYWLGGNYNLTIETIDRPIGADERNDTLSRATHTGLTLTNPGTFSYSGEIGDNTNLLPQDDVDFFKFDLDEGEEVRFPVNIELLDPIGFADNGVGRLFDSAGSEVAWNQDPQNSNYGIYQAQNTGTFYLGISSGGNNYDPNIEGSSYSWNGYGTYDLTIETTGSRTGNEANDTLTEATDTGLTLTNSGTYTFGGEIGDNTNILEDEDVDFYKFDLDIGEEVSFNLPELFDENSNPIGPATVRVFDSNGFDIGWTNDPNDPNKGTLFAPEAGTFYLGISGDSNSTYDPNIEGSGSAFNVGTYDLTIETIGRTMGTGETNDTLTEATDTGLTLAKAGKYTFSGEIGDNANILPELDVDFFKFDLDIGEEVRFRVLDEIDDPTPIMRLFDPMGIEVSSWDLATDPNDPDMATYSPEAAGTFYVGVSGNGNWNYDPNSEGSGYGGEIGTYDLTIETIGRTMGDEETNDTFTDAIDTGLTLTNSGTFTYSGEIGDNTNILPEKDVDFFKFDLDVGEVVRFPSLIEQLDEYGYPIGPIAEGRLFHSMGMEIGDDDPNHPNMGIYQAEEAGTFYLGISGVGNYGYYPDTEGSGYGGEIVGTYDLTIQTITMGDDEPNDTLTDAIDTGLTLTNSGTFTYSGEIGDNTNILPEQDVDLFKFDLDVGEVVRFPLVIETEQLDEYGYPIGAIAEGKLFDSMGMEVSELTSDPNDPTMGIYQADEAGTFYVGISGYGNFSYDPNIEGSSYDSGEIGTYDLTIETITMGTDEPNDTLADALATGLTLDSPGSYSYSGEIGDNSNILKALDVDLFEFELDIGETVRFNLPQRRDESDSLIAETTVLLFDANGFQLDWELDGLDYGQFTAQDAGTFYLGISDFDLITYDPTTIEGRSALGNSYAEGGTYDLTIETITEENVTTVFSENFNSFTGNGFAPTPGSGQLDSDNWKVTGSLADGDGTFGGTHNTGDFARGISSGSETMGGVYAFEIGTGDNILGLQPTGDDYTPGDIVLKVTNNTGSTIQHVNIAYDIFYNNNGDRANSLNFSASEVDEASLTEVLTFTTPEISDALGWQSESQSTGASGLNIAPGADFYFRWRGDDVSGSDSRDEYGIDNIVVVANSLVAENFTPTDDGTGVAVGDNLAIDFDVDVAANTGNIAIKKASDGSVVESIPVNDSKVSIASDIVTINPTSDLAEGTEYYVEIDAGAFRDFATSTVDYAGISGPTPWNFTTASTDAVILGTNETLYDGTTGVTPDAYTPQWLQHYNVLLTDTAPYIAPNASSVQTTVTDATRLDTTSDNTIYAGYSNYHDHDENPLTAQTLVNANFPTLDNALGYMVNFTIQVNSESNNGDDYNTDGKNDRAGFSTIVVSSDTTKAIELSFEEDRIWAQDVTGTTTTDLVQAEGVSLDTTVKRDYNVKVSGDTYTLFADGTPLLSGDLRDYTGVSLGTLPNPYQTANGVFLSDRNDDASAQVDIYDVSVTSPTASGSEPIRFDFDGDTTPDILWRNSSTGGNAIWLMNGDGSRKSAAYPGELGVEWQVEGVTDFDGDTTPDILWRNSSTGGNAIWLMNGDGSRKSAAYPGGLGVEWQVEGVTDFDGDTTPDILWRNSSTGGNAIWLMNSDGSRKSAAFPGGLGVAWQVEGVTDFDGDTTPDILWRNSSTGGNAIWLMNSDGSRKSAAFPGGLGVAWQVEGVTDFDGDTTPDILWRNSSTGGNAVWLMNGDGSRKSAAFPGGLGVAWQVEGVTDFDGDTTPDILWRNSSTGGNAVWLMNGDGSRKSAAYPGGLEAEWQVEGVTDFDGDTTPDILWRNSSTGGNAVWLMNGDGSRKSAAYPGGLGVEWQVVTNDSEKYDLLTGTSGVADTFALGDGTEPFYDVAGNEDYGLIVGFDSVEDTIQLHGSAGEYNLVENSPGLPSGTAIFYTTSGPDELVGVVQGVLGLDLSQSYFQYQSV